jgi:digeranylgeranylglycerophospholipid reductase
VYDAIVVGAGPAGSHVAAELARRGHRVALLEQHAAIGKKGCCTGIVGRECVEAFPVARQAVVREARGARLHSPAGASFTLEKEAAQAYILDRQAFDEAMAANAVRHGAECIMGTRVKTVSPGRDTARIEAEAGAQASVFEARAVVLACGFGSGLPASLGFGKAGDWVVGAQAEVETGADQVEVYAGRRHAPGFFAWLVPTREGKALAGLLARRDTRGYLEAFLQHLADQGRIATDRVPLRFGAIPLKPLGRTCGNRVIVVGDAAGQVKPITGGGIYYGLLCADTAVDVLDRAMAANDFSARALSEYERRWHRLLSGELRIGRMARRAFETLSDRRIESLLRVVQDGRATQSLLSDPDFSFDWHGRLILRALRRFGPRAALAMVRP